MKQAGRILAEVNRWPVLEPIEADGQVNPIALSKPVCVAGARGRVNLPLNSPQISRAHALFVADGDGVYVRDLASLNGVSVNDGPVRESILHNGDVVRIGPFSFRCAQNFPDGGTEQPHAWEAELRLPEGARVPLHGHTLLIGSREACDVYVSDKKVSAAHAVVFDREGRWFIRDLRSATGTRVNGELVGETKLEPGDELQVGDTSIQFAPVAKAEPAAAALDEIDDSLATGMDEISLAADDSLIAKAEPAEVSPAHAAEPEQRPAPAADPAIVPLIDDEEADVPASAPAPKPVEPAAAEPEVTAPPSLDDSSLIPIAVEPEPEESASEAPLASAEELLESHPSGMDDSQIADTEPSSASDLARNLAEHEPDSPLSKNPDDSSASALPHPGTLDRQKAEEAFSELLDELAENVEEVQTVWEDLKTTDPDAPARRSREPSQRGR